MTSIVLVLFKQLRTDSRQHRLRRPRRLHPLMLWLQFNLRGLVACQQHTGILLNTPHVLFRLEMAGFQSVNFRRTGRGQCKS